LVRKRTLDRKRELLETITPAPNKAHKTPERWFDDLQQSRCDLHTVRA
jgi:hypothetical protein